jgi:DNA (cytosine-5)-methyltransferase 1
MQHHRGTVQKEMIQTLDSQGGNSKGVVIIGNYMPSNYDSSRIVDNEGLAPTVRENHGTVTATQDHLRIRKLTPKECWRLMGFSDDSFEKAEKVNSNTQLYKQAGNSIVVDVLYEIFKNLLGE